MNKQGILLSVPAQEWMWTESAIGLVSLVSKLPKGSALFCDTGAHSIAAKRNHAVEAAIENNMEHVLFCDSDMRPKVEHLHALLAHDKEIIAPLCFTRTPPYKPAFMPAEGNRVEPGVGLVEAEWVGMAFTLIRTTVFEGMNSPWFEHTHPGRGEDIYFCHKVDAPILVDTNITVPHIGVVKVDAHSAQYLAQWTS